MADSSTTLEAAVDDAVSGVAALSRLKPDTDWLRADFAHWARLASVDRKAGVIRGYVVAEKGPFKTKRGEFDDRSLDTIVQLGNAEPAGLKARWTHPTLSGDGLGKFLGRSKNFRREGDKVRADLHFNRTALESPPGGGKSRGEYLMDLAESDPAAFGSSLALKADKEHRLNADGTPQKDEKGEKLLPVWRPTVLRASDIVDDGDACHTGFLSADMDSLPDGVVRQATELLNAQFAGCDRATVKARATAWLSSYLDLRFGDDDMSAETTTPVTPEPKTEPTPKEPKPPKDDDELSARLSAYDQRMTVLEKEREREQLATRTRTVDALFDRWEGRKNELGRPDPMVTPDEAKRNAEKPNLRSLLLTATPEQFDALTAMVDARPVGLFRGYFRQKIQQGNGLAAEPPEVVAAKRFAEQQNKQTARR